MSEPGPGAWVDMSAYKSLINARVASAVEAQLAPMREQLASQNARLTLDIQALDVKVASIEANIDGSVENSISQSWTRLSTGKAWLRSSIMFKALEPPLQVPRLFSTDRMTMRGSPVTFNHEWTCLEA